MSEQDYEGSAACDLPEEQLRELSPEVQREIHAATRRAVTEALHEFSKTTSYSGQLPPEALSEVSHLFGVFRDVGCGDHAAGIEGLRSVLNGFRTAGDGNIQTGVDRFKGSMKIIARIEGFGGKVAMVLFLAIMTALVGGMGTAVWHGFKIMVNAGGGK